MILKNLISVINPSLDGINQLIIFPLLRLLVSCFAILVLSACSGGVSTNITNGSKPVLSDLDIAKTLYLNKRIPDDFYREDLPGDSFYVVNQVKDVELLPVASRVGLPVEDLSTDDFAEALNWSELATVNQPSYKQLVDNSETFFYMQFTRTDIANPQLVYLNRIFKKSILDRSGVDRNLPDRYQGKMAVDLININQIKMIIEYLWSFSDSNNHGHAILSSFTTETDDEFVHIMQQANLDSNLVAGCNAIDVVERKYTIEKDTGFIFLDETIERLISARTVSAGVYELCAL